MNQGAVTWLVTGTMLLQTVVIGNTSDLLEGLVRYATRDYGRAIEELLPLANQGNPVAQEILAKIFLKGDDPTVRDNSAALKWLIQAAEAGRGEAQFELGKIYRDGRGVPVDNIMAMYWLARAAKRGMPDANNAVGEMYLSRPELSRPDFSREATTARGFFLSGAQLGSAAAMYNLGMIYLAGDEVAQDEIEAYKWFELSAQSSVGQEHDDALRALTTLREQLTPLQVGVAMAAANAWAGQRHRNE